MRKLHRRLLPAAATALLVAAASRILIIPVTPADLLALHRRSSRPTSGPRRWRASCFIWMIMIGAMVGVRDGAHFDVDLWPELTPRAERAAAASSSQRRSCWCWRWSSSGTASSSSQFGWNQTSELADLPMWLHPRRLAAGRRHLGRCSCGEQFVDDLRNCSRREHAHERRRVLSAGDGGADPVRRVLRAAGRCACRSRSRSASPACRCCSSSRGCRR